MKANYQTVLVSLASFTVYEIFCSDSSDSEEVMAGPRRHQGFFKKQPKNKTIPYSEQPGKELIVIDVDGIIWPYDVDKDPIFDHPFVLKSGVNDTVLVNGHVVEVFPEVDATLQELTEKGYVLAAVSLTNSSYKTMALLEAFDLTKRFKYIEVGPGPDRLYLLTEICERSDIPMADVLYFEKDRGEADYLDFIWKHVIIYCIKKGGLTKKKASEGLLVFDIRPRKEKKFGPQKVEVLEKSNKNKCRPAYEKDSTEIEGWDYNATKIEYS